MYKQIIHEDEDFSLSYSQFRDMAFLHCEVNKFTPSTVKRGMNKLSTFLHEAPLRGINKVVALADNNKFIQTLGGQYVGIVKEGDTEMEMYKWPLQSRTSH